MKDFMKYKISRFPDSVYYLPNFVSEDDESRLLDTIYNSPKPKWKTLSNRRLQKWGGLPHPKGMIKEKLPAWLNDCIQKVNDLGVFEKVPNHVLVNEYLPGQGIMPHEDGPLFYTTIATISLGSHTVLDYYEKQIENDEKSASQNFYIGSLLLERCSLLIVQEDLYTNHLHGIKELEVDVLNSDIKNQELCKSSFKDELRRKCRISLTIRHVPHTINANFIFGKK